MSIGGVRPTVILNPYSDNAYKTPLNENLENAITKP